MNDNGYLVALPVDLRDYFAAKALASCSFRVRPYDDTAEVAKDCYRMADAMLKERSKK